jgi:hypothetical protein
MQFLPASRLHLAALALLLALHGLLPAQSTPHCATIWNGFAQSWGYPHPVARLGDGLRVPYMGGDPCDFVAFHSGAPGRRPDQLRFRQYALRVDAPNVGFYQETIYMDLYGQEGEDIRVTTTGSFEHADLYAPTTSATLILNGFELQTESGDNVDELGEFSLHIDSTWVDPSSRRLHYRLSALLNFSCQGGDCEGFEREVNYDLGVQLLALIGGDFQIGPTELLSSTQTWTQDSILAVQPRSSNLLAPAQLPLNIPVITGFSVTLSAAAPLIGWETWLTPVSASPAGLVKFNYGLGVRQWDGEMEAAFRKQVRGGLCRPGKALLRRQEGSALSTLSIQSVQFQSGTATPYLWDGTIDAPPSKLPYHDEWYEHLRNKGSGN